MIFAVGRGLIVPGNGYRSRNADGQVHRTSLPWGAMVTTTSSGRHGACSMA